VCYAVIDDAPDDNKLSNGRINITFTTIRAPQYKRRMKVGGAVDSLLDQLLGPRDPALSRRIAVAHRRLKPLGEYDRGELAKVILKGLVVGGLIATCFVLPGMAHVLALFAPKNGRERFRVVRTLRALEKRRFVTIRHKGRETIMEITEAGKRRVLQYDLDEMRLAKPKRWDGWWRVVIFDIPETHRLIRHEINFRLNDLGLLPIQKSVFATPYECKKEIDFIGEYFGIRRYITFMRAKNIDNEEALKKRYEFV